MAVHPCPCSPAEGACDARSMTSTAVTCRYMLLHDVTCRCMPLHEVTCRYMPYSAAYRSEVIIPASGTIPMGEIIPQRTGAMERLARHTWRHCARIATITHADISDADRPRLRP